MHVYTCLQSVQNPSCRNLGFPKEWCLTQKAFTSCWTCVELPIYILYIVFVQCKTCCSWLFNAHVLQTTDCIMYSCMGTELASRSCNLQATEIILVTVGFISYDCMDSSVIHVQSIWLRFQIPVCHYIKRVTTSTLKVGLDIIR